MRKIDYAKPYTSFRENLYRLLFLLYQERESPKDQIKTIIRNIPSDKAFRNPGMPFVLSRERVCSLLNENLGKIVLLIKSEQAVPILQLYPISNDVVNAVAKAFAGEHGIPLIEHNNFKDMPLKDCFGKTHPNEKGYYMMAENIFKQIGELKYANRKKP